MANGNTLRENITAHLFNMVNTGSVILLSLLLQDLLIDYICTETLQAHLYRKFFVHIITLKCYIYYITF